MPTSTHLHISHICDTFFSNLGHKCWSFLDVGCGCGRFGLLAREMGDVIRGRIDKKTWQCKIEAIEIWEPYISPLHHHVYDAVHVVEAYSKICEMTKAGKTFDMIMLGDVVEHFDKPQAIELVELCLAMCNKVLIIGIPIGPKWPQGCVAGNVNETHRSQWKTDEFNPSVIKCGFHSTMAVFKDFKGRPYMVLTAKRKGA